MERTLPRPQGDRCAFPRNLTRGSYGGDVNCLQQHLAATVCTQRAFLWLPRCSDTGPQGFLVDEEPSGYFGAQTEAALRRWHAAQGVATPSPGLFGREGRAAYAKARPARCLACVSRLTATRL